MAETFDPWQFRAHPDVWVLIIGLAVLYGFALRRLGPRLAPAGQPVATSFQRGSFAVGLGLMWLVSDWPIHDLADSSLYSIHMVQHLVLSLVVPPLLLAGIPRWMADALVEAAGVGWLIRTFGRAVPAAIAFNAFTVLSHWPGFVNLTVESAAFHFVAHVGLVTTALLMWLPVVGPWPERRLAPLTAMFYLFIQSIIPTVPAGWLTFADAPIYTAYEGLPKAWGVTPLGDQQSAGLIMKLAGGFYLWGWITVLFFRWSARHDRAQESSYRRTLPEDLTTADVTEAFESTPPPRA